MTGHRSYCAACGRDLLALVRSLSPASVALAQSWCQRQLDVLARDDIAVSRYVLSGAARETFLPISDRVDSAVGAPAENAALSAALRAHIALDAVSGSFPPLYALTLSSAADVLSDALTLAELPPAQLDVATRLVDDWTGSADELLDAVRAVTGPLRQ